MSQFQRFPPQNSALESAAKELRPGSSPRVNLEIVKFIHILFLLTIFEGPYSAVEDLELPQIVMKKLRSKNTVENTLRSVVLNLPIGGAASILFSRRSRARSNRCDGKIRASR